MNERKMACNYAIMRFLPYPETEEFVNVGVVLACPAAHFFGFRLESQRSRVTGFFPELNKSIFVQGRMHFRTEMERVRRFLDRTSNEGVLTFAEQEFNRAFLDIVKPRESIFRFSGVGTRWPTIRKRLWTRSSGTTWNASLPSARSTRKLK